MPSFELVPLIPPIPTEQKKKRKKKKYKPSSNQVVNETRNECEPVNEAITHTIKKQHPFRTILKKINESKEE
jgi:hypothetical protein